MRQTHLSSDLQDLISNPMGYEANPPKERLLHLALRAAPVLGSVAGRAVLAVAMVRKVEGAQTAKEAQQNVQNSQYRYALDV